MAHGAPDVPENSFDEIPTAITRSMQVQADLVDDICEIRACKREILQSAYNGVMEGCIRSKLTIGGRYFGLGINWCSGRFAIAHAGATEDILRIFGLVEEEARGSAGDMNAKEKAKSTEVLHCECRAQVGDNAMEKSGTALL